ncbi:phosphotransferase enzyme family protein [Aspergillus varians]
MTPPPARVASIMLSWHSLDLVSCTTLQTLWAGYGHICAITARATTDKAAQHLDALCGVSAVEPGAAGSTYPLILKLISPPRKSAGNRGEDEGHLRKMLSYEVEQTFYSEIVPLLGDGVAVAKCLASTRDMRDGEGKGEGELAGLIATVMVDLRPRFPVEGGKRGVLTRAQVNGALDWLAGLHRRSWAVLPGGLDGYVLPPLEEEKRRRESAGGTGLWLNGGYTYLATRRKEYASLVEEADSEWSEALCGKASEDSERSVAERAALVLTPCGRPIESYIHGDVKSENLFTTASGDEVAFFDFQYVGLGLGVCDLAKLFTCSVPLGMLVDDARGPLPEQLTMRDGEMQLLKRYRASLLHNSASDLYKWDTFKRHWETALVDWCRFQASWGFWGNTEWLEARVRSILSDKDWGDWLQQETRSRDG